MSHGNQHKSHEEIRKRLKRAKGHLESVIKMIEEEKPCADVARQLQAVTKAIAAAKSVYIHDHIEHCLDGNHKNIDLDEIKEITKYI